MNKKLEYLFFDFLNGVELPSALDVQISLLNGVTPVLVLDSCVCFDIINYLDGKSVKADKIDKIINLFRYAEKSKIDILGSFGALELSFNKKSLSVDRQKFSDFGNKLEYFMHLPVKSIINKDFYKFKHKDLMLSKQMDGFLDMLLRSYCVLLKIRVLKLNKPGKINAVNNYLDLLDWMENDMDLIMVSEAELGKLVFAGDNFMLKMLGMKKDKRQAKRELWGTAWDLFHYRINTQYAPTVEMNGILNKPFFVTEDERLVKLSTQMKNRAVVKLGSQSLHGAFVYTEFNDECYKKDWDLIRAKLSEISFRRASRGVERGIGDKDLKKMIRYLEEVNQLV